MNPTVNKVMADYDKKTQDLLTTVTFPGMGAFTYSYSSNIFELNNGIRRMLSTKKIGDPRSIVEYMESQENIRNNSEHSDEAVRKLTK